MEQFKAGLKKKIRINIILLILILCGCVIIAFIPTAFSSSETSDFIKGYQIGYLGGISAVIIYHILSCRKALKKPDYLKKLYIQSTDERERYIKQLSCSVAISIAMFGLAFATVIAGFFNMVVFATLAIATLFVVVAFVSCTLYFSKKL
jgi:hypothetical protein